jgi:ornithine cyclodeaminase
MVGTGNLAPYFIKAHGTARSIKNVYIWGRRLEASQRLADRLSGSSFGVSVETNLEEAVRNADIIGCATLASEPIVKGDWLKQGQHIDLVGAFTPKMSEADSAALTIASVYVDTWVGAFSEAGEIVQAIWNRSITETSIRGSLRELVTGAVSGRSGADEITLFKSVGTALEDLAAAELFMRNYVANG